MGHYQRQKEGTRHVMDLGASSNAALDRWQEHPGIEDYGREMVRRQQLASVLRAGWSEEGFNATTGVGLLNPWEHAQTAVPCLQCNADTSSCQQRARAGAGLSWGQRGCSTRGVTVQHPHLARTLR